MSTRAAQQQEARMETSGGSRIPRFKNVEEVAEFWDTHDSADFEDKFEEVKEPVRFVVRRAVGKAGDPAKL